MASSPTTKRRTQARHPAGADAGPFAAIDFETATADRGTACAMAVSVPAAAGPATTVWMLRPPGNSYSARHMSIHRLGPTDTRDAPRLDEVWPEAEEIIGGRLLVAHNMPFDRSVLETSLHRRGVAAQPRLQWACSLAMARRVFPNWPRHKLSDLCAWLGIRHEPHNVGSDAAAVVALVQRMASTTGKTAAELARGRR